MAESEDKVVDGEGVILNSGYLTQGENQRVAGGETLQFPVRYHLLILFQPVQNLVLIVHVYN